MKALCITGVIPKQLKQVAGILQQAGMSPAAPSKHDNSVDIAYWLEQVIEGSKSGEADEEGSLQVSPDRLWEQLASDIFLANVKSPLWGWADAKNINLLEFLLNFERRLHFILVCTTPQQLLTSALVGDVDEGSTQALLSSWQSGHEQILRFYNRNAQRCVLVDAEDCIKNPALLIKHCNRQMKLGLDTKIHFTAKEVHQSVLAHYLARNIVSNHSQSATLQHELNATLTRLSTNTTAGETPLLQPDGLISNYRTLIDRTYEIRQLQKANQEIVAMKAELIGTIQKNDINLKKSQDELNKKLQELEAESQCKLKEVCAKNELLVLQLHQVQEELKESFLKYATLEKKRDELQGLLNDAIQVNEQKTRQIDESSHLMVEHDDQHANLLNERNNLTHILSERDGQLAQLIQERDYQSQLAGERQHRIEGLIQTKTQLEHQNSELRAHSHTPVESKDQSEALQTAQARFKEAAQENELLLMQLHQVQEELEHYFLQHQNLQTQLKIADDRWQRMLQRAPNYYDYESIDLLSAEDNKATWRIKGLNATGRYFANLQFDTILEDGVAGVILSRNDGTNAPLIYWPSTQASSSELTLIPVADTPEALSERVTTLHELASSDWKLLKVLAQLIEKSLVELVDFPASTSLSAGALREGLANLSDFLSVFPTTLRHDLISLKREQVNPDYEHLWLKCQNLEVGDKIWPTFEFRLSCAHVAPGKFGYFPKLEFPEEGSKAPFDSWFIEAHDDFGAKLEIRYSLPDSMDIVTWQRLSVHDQQFVTSLVARLPHMLAVLQKNKSVQLKRSWDDWNQMAFAVQRITTACATAEQLGNETPTLAPDLNPGKKSKDTPRQQSGREPASNSNLRSSGSRSSVQTKKKARKSK